MTWHPVNSLFLLLTLYILLLFLPVDLAQPPDFLAVSCWWYLLLPLALHLFPLPGLALYSCSLHTPHFPQVFYQMSPSHGGTACPASWKLHPISHHFLFLFQVFKKKSPHDLSQSNMPFMFILFIFFPIHYSVCFMRTRTCVRVVHCFTGPSTQ